MERYFLKLNYNGANYHGWQIQPNAPTVQETINLSLKQLFKEEINVVGCGRTDTGVHAVKFIAHFDINYSLKKQDFPDLLRNLNGMLPPDIAIENIFRVTDTAHARFDAISRTYQYKILRKKDPFLFDRTFPYYYGSLDFEKMNRGAEILKSYTDFTSFSKLHTDVKTNNCVIKQAFWAWYDPLLVFTITADRFLRNMVRAIVGTMIDLGRGKIDLNQLHQIIESKDRSEAGFSAPAKGLYLVEVEYPQGLLNSP